MDAYFEWLRELPLSVWIAESESIFAYPFVLFLHSVGMGLTAGLAFVIALRLLGLATLWRVSALRGLFSLFWTGFYLNLITGSILFAAAATSTGYKPIYYAKLILIAIGLALSVPIRRFIDGETSDRAIPSRIKGLAATSLLVWTGVIATGRLIAYT